MPSKVRILHLPPRSPSAGYLIALVAIYLVATLGTLAVWSAKGVYTVTGDEPHYLVIADALRNGTFDVAASYGREFADRAIYALGLAPAGTAPAPPFAHVVVTSAGMFSWHGPGIAFLLAIPFAVAGVAGAKAVMVALGALIVIVAWRVSGVFLDGDRARFLATAACALAYPVIPAATQIYPDLVAGLVVLSLTYLLLTVDRVRRPASLVGYSLLIGFLPWLGQKFAVTAVVLAVGVVVVVWRRLRSRGVVLLVGLPALASLLLYAVFNLVEFGSITGPPAQGALVAGREAAMVAWGLAADQDQGFLILNPVLWVGVAGIVVLARGRSAALVVWALTVASIWIPSALHPGLYGEGSFVGRYSWAIAVAFLVPTLAGLAAIRAWSTRAFALGCAAAIAVNVVFFAWATLGGGSAPGSPAGFDLYTKPVGTWLESYAIVTFPLQDWFPALYDVDWAFSFWPNAAWLVVLVGVVVLALRRRAGAVVLAAAAVLVAVAGVVAVPGPREETTAVDATVSAAGYVSGQPVRQMRQGPYTWGVEYSAPVPAGSAAGRWEIVESVTDAVVASGELAGTDGARRTVPIPVPYLSLHPVEYSLRVASYGPMTVLRTFVAHGAALPAGAVSAG